MKSVNLRSRWGAGLGTLVILAGTGAGAATVHRMAISTGSGSGGAQTFLQNTASGSGLQGEVSSSINTAIKIPFGVLGEYNDAGGPFGIGVAGISTTGYGVGAESLGSSPSLLALNNAGGDAAEIDATNATGEALLVQANGTGVGITTFSAQSNAIESFSQTNEIAASYSQDDASTAGYGDSGVSYSSGGIGAFGGNFSGAGVGVMAEAEGASAGLPALQAYTETDGTELFDAGVNDSNTGNVFVPSTVLSSVSNNASQGVFTSGTASSDLQMNGDIYITGAIYTDCGDNVPYATTGCDDETLVKQRTPGGATYNMYATKHASETVEDEGEAVLRNGVAHVSLDPAFSSVISTRQPYLVFTTPQGDTRGLFVTNRTAQGFDVRETSNGHNSLTFDYRIVAHPFGTESKRMVLAKHKTRMAQSGRPKASRAFAAHEAVIAHSKHPGASTATFKARKFPASFVSLK